jgi:hypothetical protein
MNSGQSHVIGFAFAQRANGMSHPDPYGPPDRTPIQIGEVWETPITGEYAKILELPYRNPEGRAVAELLARVGARVAGEHRHPGIVERFTVRRSESRLGRCDRKARRPDKHSSPRGECHYRTGYMARLVERERPRRPRARGSDAWRALRPETLFGLARLGHTDAKGMPHLLQLALIAREFSDVIVFRSPPLAMQRALFGVLTPIAHWRGYRATYPQLSRTVLAPRT